MQKIAPVFVAILGNDLVVGDRVGLGTPNVDVRSIHCGVGGHRVLRRVGPDPRGANRSIYSPAELLVRGRDFIDRTADEIRPAFGRG